MSESRPPDPLRRLGAEIDEARQRSDRDTSATPRDITSGGGALGYGLRIGIELLAALIVGVGLGWLADSYLGSRPWGLIVGFFLGSAAGVANVFRASQRMGGPPSGGRG